MTFYQKIQELIKSCKSENIKLAFELAKSQDLREDKIIAPWKELIDFFLKEHLIRIEMNNIEKLTLILNYDGVSFWSDNIVYLPEKIGALKNLKRIGIEQNELKELPKSFASLSQLEEVWLWDNKIEKLPENIGKLSNLKKLYIHENSIKKIPQSIYNLKKLENFVLYENQIPDQEIQILKKKLPNCKFDF